ncbi:MAG: MFS transporter [Ardenticatenaceae bacterium]|nr:MFS transporter [Ardenticatenaceae bacterium]
MNQSPTKEKPLKPFLILWGGQAASLFGSQLVQFALIWWLTTTTGSATVLALASLMGLLPQVVLGPFVGVLVDRWNRRLTMLLADGLVALATVVLVLLFWSGQAAVWQVYVVLFVRALGGAFHWPAMQSSTTLMVPQEYFTRIQGLNQTLNGSLNIISAPLGALLLGVLPMQGVLMIDVITAVFAIIPLLIIHIPQPENTTRPSGQPANFWREFWTDMAAGLRYLRAMPALMLLMGMAMIVNLVLNPAFSLVPLLVTNHFQGSALQLGFIESSFGVGLLVGGLLLSVWGGFHRRIVTSLVGLIGMGVAILLVGLTPAYLFWLAVAATFVIGFSNSLTNGPVLALFQVLVVPEMQGRIFTLLTSLSAAMAPLGLILAGPLADQLGVRTWFLIGGSVTLLMGIAGFFIPMILSIEDATAPESSGKPLAETAVADPTI